MAITPAGREMQRRMWQVYAPAIRAEVGDRLGDEAAALAALLARLAD